MMNAAQKSLKNVKISQEADSGWKLRQSQSSVAMTLLLVSLSMLFATLFLVYGILRGSSPLWPPMGIGQIPRVYPLVSTIVIVISSLSFILAQKNRNKFFYFLTVILGSLFLGCQFLLWAELKRLGLYTSTGTFTSLIYGFTWIHSAHIFCGLIALFFLFPIFMRVQVAPPSSDQQRQKENLRVSNIGMFWHFLGVVWVLIYLSMFVF